MRVFHHPFTFLAVVALAACGGSEPAPATPPAGGTAAPVASAAPATSAAPVASAAPASTPAAPAAPAAWKGMTNEQKLEHMKTVIQPTMGAVFKGFDGKHYADFGCKTCHGERKEDPHKALPKLTLSGDGFKKLMAEKPAVMKFMGEQVTPAMAKAMGEKPFDPASHTGFGCGGCHTVQ